MTIFPSSTDISGLREKVVNAIRESEAYWWNRSDEPEDGLAETLEDAVLGVLSNA